MPPEDPTPTPVPEPEPTPEPQPAASPPSVPGEGEQEPTAEELKHQLQEAQVEIERLKAEPPAEEEPEEPEPAAVPSDRQPIGVTATQVFVRQTMPEAKKRYAGADVVKVKDDGTVVADPEGMQKQFDVMVDTVDHLVGAVLQDQVRPATVQLASALIEANNEIEMLQLKLNGMLANDLSFKQLEPAVRKSLAKLAFQDRAKPNVVTNLYHQLRGSRPAGSKDAPPARQPPSAILRDVSAGGGAPRKSVSARLTANQEAERKAIEAEQDTPFTPEQYLAKLKVRQDRAKANNRPEPKLLRDQ